MAHRGRAAAAEGWRRRWRACKTTKFRQLHYLWPRLCQGAAKFLIGGQFVFDARAAFRRRSGSRTARDLFGLTDEPALLGDELPAFAAGIADRPAPCAFEVIRVNILVHSEVNEESTYSAGTDEQIAAGQTLIHFIVSKLIRVHRENSNELRDEERI